MRLLAAVLAAVLPMCGPTDQSTERRCRQWEPLLEAHNPGWDVSRMSRIAWRESRCQPEVRSRTRDTGLLQINDVNHRFLSERFGQPVTVELLKNPMSNVAAAAELFKFWRRAAGDGYQPWKISDSP